MRDFPAPIIPHRPPHTMIPRGVVDIERQIAAEREEQGAVEFPVPDSPLSVACRRVLNSDSLTSAQ